MLTTQKYIVYLKAHNKKDYIEGTKGIKFKDGLNNQASLKLSQLVQNPDFVYKGCVYSEGIRDYSVKIIPKSTLESSMNALAQFKKCIFLVEPQAQANFAFEYRKIVDEIELLKETRAVFFEKDDQQALAKMDQEL